MEISKGWKYAYIYVLNTKVRLTYNAMFKWFWTISSLGAPDTYTYVNLTHTTAWIFYLYRLSSSITLLSASLP